MTFLRKYQVFIILDFVTLVCWLFTHPQMNPFYEAGPIDAQNSIFFFLLLLPYFLVLGSIVYLIYFMDINRKSISVIGPALLLYIHIFVGIIYLCLNG